MPQTDCLHCLAFREPRAWSSPKQLRDALDVLRHQVAGGVFTVADLRDGAVRGDQPPFAEVAAAGPWPDAFGYEFRCRACGGRFALTGET